MPIIEDDVKRALKTWMEDEGYTSIDYKLGNKRGYDVEGVNPRTSRKLVIECKGEAQTGKQWPRSWGNTAAAILTSLIENENPSLDNEVGMAFPDTEEYRSRMRYLKNLFNRESISVFWVSRMVQLKSGKWPDRARLRSNRQGGRYLGGRK